MADKQRTIQQPVSVKGKGLHTGVEVEVVICPAEVNTGYVFQRVDLEGQPKVDAVADNVTDTSRGTTLVQKGVKIHTVEHVLASLSGMGIDNALIWMAVQALLLEKSQKLELLNRVQKETILSSAKRLSLGMRKTILRLLPIQMMVSVSM